ncbi:hypothetical protein [Nocardia farcinica]|nr:hypothetical protein [Nocardia farcinica]
MKKTMTRTGGDTGTGIEIDGLLGILLGLLGTLASTGSGANSGVG